MNSREIPGKFKQHWRRTSESPNLTREDKMSLKMTDGLKARNPNSPVKRKPRNTKGSDPAPIKSKNPVKKKSHKQYSPLLKLPNELILLIAEQINNVKDLYSLILANRRCAYLLQEKDLLQRFALMESKEVWQHQSKLIWAVDMGYDSLVKRLLRNRNDTNYINIGAPSKWTALNIAVIDGREEITQLLLENGASVSTACKHQGRTPLHYAVVSTRGTARIVQLLLEHGADPSIRDRGGCPPIHSTLLFHSFNNTPDVATSMVKLMLDKGADITGVYWERTPLHYAVHTGNRSAARLLLDYGADTSVVDISESIAEWCLREPRRGPWMATPGL